MTLPVARRGRRRSPGATTGASAVDVADTVLGLVLARKHLDELAEAYRSLLARITSDLRGGDARAAAAAGNLLLRLLEGQALAAVAVAQASAAGPGQRARIDVSVEAGSGVGPMPISAIAAALRRTPGSDGICDVEAYTQ